MIEHTPLRRNACLALVLSTLPLPPDRLKDPFVTAPMRFLDTTPFRYDEQLEPALREPIERHRVRGQRPLQQTLANLKRIEAPIRVGLPEAGAFFSATLWSVDAAAERMVLLAAREPGVREIVTDPGRLWGAAYDGNCKVQFDLRGRTLAAQGDFWVVGSRLPSAMYLLPRRTDVRTRHGEGNEARVLFSLGEGGQRLRLPLHDISAGGFSFLLSPGEARLSVGMQVCGAEIELAPGEFLFADFHIRNVQLHDEDGGQLRFGCAWSLLSPAATRLLEHWGQHSRQRRQMLSLDL